MAYQTKRTITNLITGVLVLAAYCIYAFGKYQSGSIAQGDFKFWAGTMLLFIGIGIVAAIFIQIIFHIVFSIGIAVKEREHTDKKINSIIEATIVEDEMDKLIQLKSLRIGFVFAGLGFVAALILLFFNHSPAVAFNVMFLSYSVGSMSEGVASLYYYKKGVRNG